MTRIIVECVQLYTLYYIIYDREFISGGEGRGGGKDEMIMKKILAHSLYVSFISPEPRARRELP